MDSSRILHQILNGMLSQGHRSHGRPKKHYKDCIKNSLKYFNFPVEELESRAEYRLSWHAVTNQAYTGKTLQLLHRQRPFCTFTVP